MPVTSQSWLDAQNAVLGSVLISPELTPRVMTETVEQDYSGPCLTVYRAIRKLFLAGTAIDVISVANALSPSYRDFLLQLTEITPTAANIDHYIRLCREQARVLAIRDIGNQLVTAETTDSVRALLEDANGLMVARRSRKTVNMSEALRSFMDRHTKTVKYLNWPIREFNDYLHSEPGDFIIFGAEPSTGKTALALQCAWHWAQELKVGFFSFETSSEKLFDRKMASIAGLGMQKIKTNAISQQEWERICMETETITSRKLELVPAAGMTTADIRAEIIECGYQLVVIDYLQLISSRGINRYEQVTNISIELHNMAQSLGVTVVALSQLSRSDDDHTPRNSDLRESGQLEQDADVILMLKLEKQSEPSGPRKAFVTKNKEGELFMMHLDFDGRHQTFSKAQRVGDTVSKYVNDGKKARRKNQQAAQQPGQMTMLPGDFPVPF
ncbi:MAG: AAA family ATPase [Oscillospiraceae bacterium]|nr:AAA family ATPase [Oscillospiraceae bacterium]MBR2422034.1 AAA family ATPase [Oscillospiraceae bacterium]